MDDQEFIISRMVPTLRHRLVRSVKGEREGPSSQDSGYRINDGPKRELSTQFTSLAWCQCKKVVQVSFDLYAKSPMKSNPRA